MNPCSPNANTVIVPDFETTGLSPNQGDRAIEIGAVKLEQGQVIDRFQCLMNPNRRVDGFIEDYTGITNEMLEDAPPCSVVMEQFSDFVGDSNMVAHNASFDKQFLDSECSRIDRRYGGDFACSMLISRRIYPDAPNHKLGTLVEFKNLPNDGTFHRALADAEMTAHLWMGILGDIQDRYQISEISFNLMRELSQVSKWEVSGFFERNSA
ncbi:MAG TPA: 3'-5' exonuclease [Chromatiaceae bacterium]|jgi:DNA polymerase-3 subunit epsilon|nr:3'-5' exonuclease [Chromatiaceae bacterium]